MPKFNTNTQVDFVVIGTGAAGGVMAKELSTAGFTVVVLEAGPYLRTEDYSHDELGKMQNRPSLINDTRLQPTTFRQTANEKAVRANAILYGRCVGGGTVHYTGSAWRHHEVDFIERTTWGDIRGTGLADWPITYKELEPYYTKVEWELGLSGLGDGAPRSKPYPLSPMPTKSAGVLFDRAAKKLGFTTVPTPLGIISKDYGGRKACAHCGFCSGYICEHGSRSSTLVTVIPVAEKTGRCEIRDNSYAREIMVDRNGRVTGVVYFDALKRENFQRAKAVVVSCNAVESARLLLLSKSSFFPNGLANSSGLVGKYTMFGGNASARALFEHPLNEYKSVGTTRATESFYDSDPKRGFFGGARLDARGGFNPIAFGLGGLNPDAPRWGMGFRKALEQDFSRTMVINAFVTSLPLETNTIDLDPDAKDDWGLPAMRVTYKEHPDDIKARTFMTQRAVEILEAAGARKVWPQPVSAVRNGGHLMGTCRMGNDPKTSVVNKYSRAHDVPNLYVVDGSNFVTSGRNHPTTTISALAYHSADYIRRTKGGTTNDA